MLTALTMFIIFFPKKKKKRNLQQRAVDCVEYPRSHVGDTISIPSPKLFVFLVNVAFSFYCVLTPASI